jgi:hypothetical protein
MTARINSFTVILEKDMREDDAEALKSALSMMKGVISVQGNVTDVLDVVSYSRAKMELVNKVVEMINKN